VQRRAYYAQLLGMGTSATTLEINKETHQEQRKTKLKIAPCNDPAIQFLGIAPK
jgi:hypothetical protein